MDQYKDDQVIQILNDEYFEKGGNSSIERGIQINEFPSGTSLETRNKKLEEFNKITNKEERETKINEFINKEGSRNRLFLGRTRGNSSGLFLAGPDGQLKMMIYVDEKGNPKIDTFDEKGNSKSFIN